MIPFEIEAISISTLLWAKSSLGTPILIALFIQAVIASLKKDVSRSLLNLSLLGLGAVIQMGFPLYDIRHAASSSGVACFSFFSQSVWVAIWHLSVSSLLLFVGFVVLISTNRQQGLLKKYLPVTASFLLLFIYSIFLLIAGIR